MPGYHASSNRFNVEYEQLSDSNIPGIRYIHDGNLCIRYPRHRYGERYSYASQWPSCYWSGFCTL